MGVIQELRLLFEVDWLDLNSLGGDSIAFSEVFLLIITNWVAFEVFNNSVDELRGIFDVVNVGSLGCFVVVKTFGIEVKLGSGSKVGGIEGGKGFSGGKGGDGFG